MTSSFASLSYLSPVSTPTTLFHPSYTTHSLSDTSNAYQGILLTSSTLFITLATSSVFERLHDVEGWTWEESRINDVVLRCERWLFYRIPSLPRTWWRSLILFEGPRQVGVEVRPHDYISGGRKFNPHRRPFFQGVSVKKYCKVFINLLWQILELKYGICPAVLNYSCVC